MSELRLGWWLSSEEHDPRDLVRHAQLAESIELPTAMLSDHLLPWVRRQGNAGHAWTTLGAIAHANLRLMVRPAAAPPIHVAAAGTRSATLAGEVGDGLIMVTPDAAPRRRLPRGRWAWTVPRPAQHLAGRHDRARGRRRVGLVAERRRPAGPAHRTGPTATLRSGNRHGRSRDHPRHRRVRNRSRTCHRGDRPVRRRRL